MIGPRESGSGSVPISTYLPNSLYPSAYLHTQLLLISVFLLSIHCTFRFSLTAVTHFCLYVSPTFGEKRGSGNEEGEVGDGGKGGQVDNRGGTKRKAKMKKGAMFTTQVGWNSDRKD